MPGFFCSQRMPTAALCSKRSPFGRFSAVFGMGIKNRSTTKATAKLHRSMAITASMPARPSTAVARIGVRIELTELDRYRREPTF